jgi:hypothetical protein
MQTFLSGVDLILWIAVAALSLTLLLTALFRLFKTEFEDARVELGWVVLIIFVPVAGPLLYFIYLGVLRKKAKFAR